MTKVQNKSGSLPSLRDKWLAIASVIGIIICLLMTLFEFSRAIEGNPRSWFYTFEWPLFAAVIIWIWHRLEHQSYKMDSDEPGGQDVD